MDFNEKAKLATQRLNDAVNAAAAESDAVRDAVRKLRELGYEPRLTFQLELAQIEQADVGAEPEIEEDFTAEDRKALRRMLIRIT